jgi:hypothetical protein
MKAPRHLDSMCRRQIKSRRVYLFYVNDLARIMSESARVVRSTLMDALNVLHDNVTLANNRP